MFSQTLSTFDQMNPVRELIGIISELTSKHGDSPLLVAVCGAADLGKTHLSMQLVSTLTEIGTTASHITLDSYLMDRVKRVSLGVSGYQPEAYDLPKIKSDLIRFLKGSSIEYFPYDHSQGKSSSPKIKINPCHVLFVDGLHSMHEYFRSYISFSIFIYTSDDFLLKIRHKADIKKRKQTVEFSSLNLEKELAAYKLYVEHYMSTADLVYELKKQWQYEPKVITKKT